MSLPDDSKTDDKEQGDNVIRLGTETLFAIAEQLRQMYDMDLRTKPSEKLERLMRRIERGDEPCCPVCGTEPAARLTIPRMSARTTNRPPFPRHPNRFTPSP